jgi:hypothetical protein
MARPDHAGGRIGGAVAYQNKANVYGLLFKLAAEKLRPLPAVDAQRLNSAGEAVRH